MKKVVCLLLTLCLCAALCIPALAWPQNYEECWDYVSWVRDGSLDERNDPFEADKKITICGWDEENEVPANEEQNYEYVARDTSWTVKNIGTGNYYIWIYAGVLSRMDDGSYDDDGGMSLRESGFADRAMDEEGFEGFDAKVKRLYPGESVTFSFDTLIATGYTEVGNDPPILDKGDGQYLYPLYIHMEFPDENNASVWLCKNFMFNETEVQRMKAEFGGGQASGNPAPAPDNAEPKPDNAAPEANSPEPQASGKQFADVSNTAYYHDAVYWALRQNITEGVTDTAFSPNDACTRAQILTFIWRYAGKQEPGVSNPFHDVSADDYYYKAALWAYEKGMVSGTAFNGDTPCDRAAAVTYLWILAGRPDTPIAGDTMFADIGSMEHPEAVAYATRTGITKGTTETTFSPDRICTRAHIVTFLNRYEQQFNGV